MIDNNQDITQCNYCGAKIKHERNSLHICDIVYDCGCRVLFAIDAETHSDTIDVVDKCPNMISCM